MPAIGRLDLGSHAMPKREQILRSGVSVRIVGTAMLLAGLGAGTFVLAYPQLPADFADAIDAHQKIWLLQRFLVISSASLVVCGCVFVTAGKRFRELLPARLGQAMTPRQWWTLAIGVVFCLGVTLAFQWLLGWQEDRP
jgi:hypothetical protein